jgi:hypothetical protein
VKRIAARGFVVLAPDVYTARFIEKFPIEHAYAIEDDVDRGRDVAGRPGRGPRTPIPIRRSDRSARPPGDGPRPCRVASPCR